MTLNDGNDPRLTVVRESPLNAETPLHLLEDFVTPTPLFYLRSNFPVPNIRSDSWRLVVDGEVERALSLSYSELVSLPAQELTVTVECAGNGRSYFNPKANGEQWSYGAVGNAVWTGTPLRTILEMAGIKPPAVEILCIGADRGSLPDGTRQVAFERSLPLETGTAPNTLLAWAMNGEPLTAAHGYPLRLIVPGWYGMASVKWLARISVLANPFEGFYQRERYVIVQEGKDNDSGSGRSPTLPVTRMEPRALITSPVDGSRLEHGRVTISGLAWSGSAPIEQVELSLDGGATWEPTSLVGPKKRYTWRRWEYDWGPNNGGWHQLVACATDVNGNTQPAEASWNKLGYKNNSFHRIGVEIEG